MLGVRISKSLEVQLEHLCQETGHSRSYFVREALRTYLEDREDYLLGIAALERNETTISLEELRKKLDLED